MILYFRWIEYLEIFKNWEIEYNRNFAEIYFWSKMADPTFSRTRRQLRIIAVQKWPQLEKKVKYDIYDLFSSLFCPPFIIETNLRIIKHPMCIYLFPGFEHQRIYFRSKRNTNKYNRTYFFFFLFTIYHISIKSWQIFALLLWRALKNYTNYHHRFRRFKWNAITQRIDGNS